MRSSHHDTIGLRGSRWLRSRRPPRRQCVLRKAQARDKHQSDDNREPAGESPKRAGRGDNRVVAPTRPSKRCWHPPVLRSGYLLGKQLLTCLTNHRKISLTIPSFMRPISLIVFWFEAGASLCVIGI